MCESVGASVRAFSIYDLSFVPSIFATISLVGRCIATNSFADLLANSFNFATAASRPTMAARHMRAPSGRLSKRSYSRFILTPFDSGPGCEKGIRGGGHFAPPQDGE